MISCDFAEAYRKVRSGYSEQAWLGLSQREVSQAIYAELRAQDFAYCNRTQDAWADSPPLAAE